MQGRLVSQGSMTNTKNWAASHNRMDSFTGLKARVWARGVSRTPCTYRPSGRTLPCLPASGGCWRCLAPVICGHVTPVSASVLVVPSPLCVCISFVSYKDTECRALLGTPGWSYLRVFKLITSAKPLFQSRSHSQALGFGWGRIPLYKGYLEIESIFKWATVRGVELIYGPVSWFSDKTKKGLQIRCRCGDWSTDGRQMAEAWELPPSLPPLPGELLYKLDISAVSRGFDSRICCTMQFAFRLPPMPLSTWMKTKICECGLWWRMWSAHGNARSLVRLSTTGRTWVASVEKEGQGERSERGNQGLKETGLNRRSNFEIRSYQITGMTGSKGIP